MADSHLKNEDKMDDDIIRMAREAGLPLAWVSAKGVIQWAQLERFAALVRADERERIAAEWDGYMYGDLEDVDIGAAIRVRSKE